MNQPDLIARIAKVLGGQERIAGAFLGGSFGRGEADDYSDVDVYVVVAVAEDIPVVLAELGRLAGEVSSVLFSNVLANARTVNSITVEWQRFDFTVISQAELAFFAQDQLQLLFDRLGVFETLRAKAEHRRNLSAQMLLDIVNEFIRVVGLSVVVTGRDDPIVAQTGADLLRDMLIRIMLLENAPQPQRGALSLRRSLTPDQYATLSSLPRLERTWPSIHARTGAIAEQFLPRARALAVEVGAAWPEAFERVTLAHVHEKLGLNIRPSDG